MAEPHDVPALDELVAAVREWLDGLHGDDPPDLYDVRVASNVLAVVEREIQLGGAHRDAHRRRLARLGVVDDAELCERIRSGALDDRMEEVRDLVWASVRDKLAVANPRYLERP